MVSETSASFFAGAFAGLVTDLSLHPIDTIKTKLQTTILSSSSSTSTPKPPSSSTFKQLYRGITPALLGSCPSGAAFFGAYQFIGGKLDIENVNNSSLDMISRSLVACSFAEASACLVRANVDIVKNNMQVGTSFDQAIKLLTLRNFSSVYVALLYRELPFAMIQLPLLELLRSNALVRCVGYHLSDEYWNIISDKRVASTVVAGFFAGGTAGFLTTPFDVYKTRVAVDSNKDIVNKRYTSFANFLQTSFREEGLKRGLFRGGFSRVTMISVGGSIFFGSQEWAKKKLLVNI